MAEPTSIVFRMAGWGKTQLVLSGALLTAGQPSNGYRRRTVPCSEIEGFFIERGGLLGSLPPTDHTSFNGNFLLAFRDGGRRRVYRMAVNADATELHQLVDALARRIPGADLTELPPTDAYARLRVSSAQAEVVKVLAVVVAGFVLIALVVFAMVRHL